MVKSEFEHKFQVGSKVKYPEDNQLKPGSIDQVIFHQKEISGDGEVRYHVVPQGKSARHAVIRGENDLIEQ